MRIILLIVVVALSGCSNASKKTNISLPQNVDLVFSVPFLTDDTIKQGEKPWTIHIEQKVTLSGLEVVTDTEQTPKADGKFAVPVGVGGSAPTANVAGQLEQGDIDANFEKDESQQDVGNPQDNKVDNSVTTPGAVVSNGGNSAETPGGAPVPFTNNTEKITLHWSDDRGRQVTWLKHPASYYGLPIEFKLSGACSGTYVIEKLDPKKIGSTSFTVVDDFHFGSDNPKAAEALAPKKCGNTGAVVLEVNYKK